MDNLEHLVNKMSSAVGDSGEVAVEILVDDLNSGRATNNVWLSQDELLKVVTIFCEDATNAIAYLHLVRNHDERSSLHAWIKALAIRALAKDTKDTKLAAQAAQALAGPAQMT